MLLIKLTIILFSFSAFSHLPCYGRDFTLKEAINYANEHNAKIISAKNKIEKAKIILKDAQRVLDPSIALHLGYNPIDERNSVGFSVSQSLEKLIGANRTAKNLASLDLDSAKQELSQVQAEIIRQVLQSFNHLEGAKYLLRLKQGIAEDCKKSEGLAKEKFDMGLISLDELLSKQAHLRLAEFEVEEAESKLQEAVLEFYQALGYQQQPEY